MSVNDAIRFVTDDCRKTPQIVASLTDNSRGVIYDRNMFIVQATVEKNKNNFWLKHKTRLIG